MRIPWALGALLFAVGCAAAPAPEPGSGDGVVLFVDWRPGLTSMHERYDPPEFVLYGDGVAIAREDRGTAVPQLFEYHLQPRRVHALFGEAADAGLFDGADYALDGQVVDAGALLVMVRTEDREHLAKVVLPDPNDSGARGEAAAFAETLRSPSRWAASDLSEPPAPYRPSRVAVSYVVTATGDNGGEAPRPWPLTETEPIQSRCVVRSGAAATRADELADTRSPTTYWHHGSTTFQALVRPLLPDEADCGDIEPRYNQ